MTDYQQIRVVDRKGTVVTIEVVEQTEVRALEDVIEGERIREGMKSDAIKLAAMLLLDEKGRSGDIDPPSDDPQPEDFVSDVHVVSAGTDGESYRAVLAVTMTKAKYAKAFEVDEELGAAADLGGDFDNCFL